MAETERVGRSYDEVAYEGADLPAGKVAAVLGVTLAVLVLAGFAVWGVWQKFGVRGQAPEPVRPLRAVAAEEPRLQTAPAADLAALRAKEERQLHASGVDAATGNMRIPIEQAMALLVKRAQKSGARP